MMYSATALALMIGTASGATTSNADYFTKRMACTMKIDGEMVTGKSPDKGGVTGCPEVATLMGTKLTPNCTAAVAALDASDINFYKKEVTQTYEITEASVQSVGTRSKGYTTWQPAYTTRKWGRWVDPESPICGDALAMQAAVMCGLISTSMTACGPKYVKYDEALMTQYEGSVGKPAGKTTGGFTSMYQLCGPHQKVACEDSIYDTAIVLFFLICGAALVIIFFQCSLMGLYDLLFGGKADVGDGASAPGATNQP